MDACGIRAIVVGGLRADLRVITFQQTSELGQPAGDVAASGLMNGGLMKSGRGRSSSCFVAPRIRAWMLEIGI
jgi:hypothetical protein